MKIGEKLIYLVALVGFIFLSMIIYAYVNVRGDTYTPPSQPEILISHPPVLPDVTPCPVKDGCKG